jgi:aspartyl protease family protein
MTRTQRTFVGAILLTAAVLMPQSGYAAAIPDSVFSYFKWSGMAYTNDKTRSFSHCAVKNTYVGGTTLLFAVFPNRNVSIAFARPDWAFAVGQAIPSEIRIDQGFSMQVTGVAYTPSAYVVIFPPGAAIFGNLALGSVMTVLTRAGGSRTYSLDDADQALELAYSCATKYQAKAGIAPPENLEPHRRQAPDEAAGSGGLDTADDPAVTVLRPARSHGHVYRAGPNGHFILAAEVNGAPVRFLVDTGASLVTLTPDDARAAGFTPRDLDYTQRASTANGVVRAAPVLLREVRIDGFSLDNVRAVVEDHVPQSLLGMSFLDRLKSFAVREGSLILKW